MPRPVLAGADAVESWLAAHPGWTLGESEALGREFRFDDFATALAFVVRVGAIADEHDHHPDVELSWGKARIRWTTHDAGGITAKDFELADTTERLYDD